MEVQCCTILFPAKVSENCLVWEMLFHLFPVKISTKDHPRSTLEFLFKLIFMEKYNTGFWDQELKICLN